MEKIGENIENLTIKEQREKLLELNPDLLYGVYKLKEETDSEINLDFAENILTCYQNQLDNIKGIEDCPDISILDLGSLRNNKVELLAGNKNFEKENLVLLSNGVIELVEAKNNSEYIKKELEKLGIEVGLINKIIEINENNDLEKTKKLLGKILKNKGISGETIDEIQKLLGRYHVVSTLRDGGSADKKQRTTTAGRNSSSDLNEDLEREHIEESPFLGFDVDGNFALATSDTSEESKEILKESIKRFLEKKYLKKGDENYEYVKKNFERNFPGIKYDNLGNILKEIIDNDRFYQYNSEPIDKIDGMEDNFKKVKLGDSEIDSFVYFDKDNNTIEYRKIRKITGFQEGFKPLSKRAGRLYLESENQYPKTHRVENSKDGFVPTNAKFAEEYSKKVLEIL